MLRTLELLKSDVACSFFFFLLFSHIVRKWPASCWLLQANNIAANESSDNITVNQWEALDRPPSTYFLGSHTFARMKPRSWSMAIAELQRQTVVVYVILNLWPLRPSHIHNRKLLCSIPYVAAPSWCVDTSGFSLWRHNRCKMCVSTRVGHVTRCQSLQDISQLTLNDSRDGVSPRPIARDGVMDDVGLSQPLNRCLLCACT